MSLTQDTSNRTEYWTRHIETWQCAGGSRAQYCRDNELSYYVFNYWHSKIASSTKPSNLVPVVVNSINEKSDTGTLQLKLPNGMQLTGIGSDSVELVGRLLAQL